MPFYVVLYLLINDSKMKKEAWDKLLEEFEKKCRGESYQIIDFEESLR